MIYRAVRLDEREMNGGAFFSDVEWASLGGIIAAFKDRLQWYYLDAATVLRRNTRQFDHVIMGISCLLIDTLSQFHFGRPSGTRTDFIGFLREYIPRLDVLLPASISHQNDHGREPAIVTRYSEALYRGVRCGILHDANVLPYVALSTDANLGFEAVGLSEYDGTVKAVGPCPTIRFNSWVLCDWVRAALDSYCARLQDPAVAFDLLRDNFKDKFKWSFGVDIAVAVL